MTGPVVDCIGEFFMADGNILSVSLFDNNILNRGISIYEVVKIKERVPLFFEDHIKRLDQSAKVAGTKSYHTRHYIENNVKQLLRENRGRMEGNIRILLHFPDSLDERPSLFCYFIPHYYPTVEEYASGISLVFVKASRRLVHSKIINLEFRSLVNRKIAETNAYEALLTDNAGYITEGSKSNFFMIKNNAVFTAPQTDVLPGITRKRIIEICRDLQIGVEEKKIHISEIDEYESCFISGTSPGILAVKNIGPTIYSTENQVLKVLSQNLNKMVDSFIKKNKSHYA